MANAKSIQDDLDKLTHDPLPTLTEEIVAEFGGKEREPVKITEIQTHVEIEKHPETAGYIERVEKQAELKTLVMDDSTGQSLVSSADPIDPVVTLPLSDDQIVKGLHHHVWEAIRWLATWCVRQAKILHKHIIGLST